MKKFRVEKLCVLFLSLFFLSFQFPVQNGIVTSTFGESRGDHLHDGIDMVASTNHVYPVDDGSVLYFWNRELFPFDPYTGSGNYTFIAHQADKVSLYLHLEDQSAFNEQCETGTAFARYGNTGRSYGTHIHVGFFDRVSWSSYNFFAFKTPEDTAPPQIGTLAFVIDGKLMRISDRAQVRLTKHHPLYVEIHDGSGKGENYGIYKMSIDVNNINKQNIVFDQINYEKNKLTIDGKTFDDIFCKDGFYKADNVLYVQGSNTISVHAEDYNGNATTKEFVIDIALDMQQ